MRRASFRAILAALATYGVVVTGAWVWARVEPTSRSCPSTGTLVLVDTDARVLCLCRNGRVEGRFRAALGRGGREKQREGDGKTPLGRYSLAQGRPSTRYHLFIPVGYPTPAQQARGYSGAAIGVHGPHIAFAWLGHATVWLDWTQGCVAVATTGEVERIAKWIHDAGVLEIVLV
jgi:hypothetical protein